MLLKIQLVSIYYTMPRKTRKVYVRLFDFKIDNVIMETESS